MIMKQVNKRKHADRRQPTLSDVRINEEEPMGVFCEDAERKLPLYPTFSDDIEVHPDLINLVHKCFNGRAEQRPDVNMARKITDATLKMQVEAASARAHTQLFGGDRRRL